MRVGINREGHSELLGTSCKRRRKVEPQRLPIDFERRTRARRGGKDRVVVKIIAVEASQHASRRMSDDRDIWVLARANEPRRHRLAPYIERGVDAADDD